MKVNIASQNTGVMSTPNAGGTISFTACSNGCVGITINVIHIGNDAFSDFESFFEGADTVFNSFDSIESVVVVTPAVSCVGIVDGVSLLLLLLLFPILLLAIISGYQLKTTRASIAKDMKFKNGSNTLDNGCTQASVCDVVTVPAAMSRADTKDAGLSSFPFHCIIKGLGIDRCTVR